MDSPPVAGGGVWDWCVIETSIEEVEEENVEVMVGLDWVAVVSEAPMEDDVFEEAGKSIAVGVGTTLVGASSVIFA